MKFSLEDGLGAKLNCLYFFASETIKANENYSLICTVQRDTFNKDENVCLYVESVVSYKDFQE